MTGTAGLLVPIAAALAGVCCFLCLAVWCFVHMERDGYRPVAGGDDDGVLELSSFSLDSEDRTDSANASGDRDGNRDGDSPAPAGGGGLMV